MNETEIKAEMRLWTLEVVVANAFAMLCASLDPKPEDLLKQIHDQMIEGAKKRTFSGVHPAMSDHYSAELQVAVDRLMGMVGTQMRVRRQDGG